jgi:PAS domain S-box-containing protein
MHSDSVNLDNKETRTRNFYPGAGMKKPEDDLFFANVIDHVAHPIFIKNRDFLFVYVNRAFAEMMGRSREELIGKTDYDMLDRREEADFFRAKDIEMFTTQRQVEIDEEPITDQSGRRRILATTKVPLSNSAGEVTHLVGIIHDISELKATQEALRLANEGLEQRVEERTRDLRTAQEGLIRKERLSELGKLAGGVAHEIRNPLTAIKNAAYVLERQLGKSTSPEVTQALAIVHDEVARANHIVGELLDYARVREPERRRVAVVDLISAAIKASDVPSGVAVVVDPAIADVMVDATQVEAALSNVIRNSVEAMHGTGEITFEIHSDAAVVRLRVCDSGPGVPAEVEGRLFEPLVTTKASGLGLGLITARTLVERQGGTLVYYASIRPGACFEMSLPRAA